MRVRIVHPGLDENDDYACGTHFHDEVPSGPSEGVISWQQRHGMVNPVTGALHPKNPFATAPLTWPIRQYSPETHKRVYAVIQAMRAGKPVKAQSQVHDGIDERTDPDFQSLLRLLVSPEWKRAREVQQLYPAVKGHGSLGSVANRQSHGIDAAWVAGTLALRMGLNPWLAVVAAAAHDIGHSAFAHPGEEALHKVLSTVSSDVMQGFEHAYEGGVIVSRGHLNFTPQASNSIACHSWPLQSGMTVEAVLNSLADRITYVASDLHDILVVGILNWDEIYRAVPKIFQLAEINEQQFHELGALSGPDGIQQLIIKTLTRDVLNQFWATNEIGFSPFGAAALHELRSFIPDQTFRTPKHQAWQGAQGVLAEFVATAAAKKYRKNGFSADEALVFGAREFASMTDAQAYRTARDLGFKSAERLSHGPPTRRARVHHINRQGGSKKATSLVPLSRIIPSVELLDGRGDKVRLTVTEALLALRMTEVVKPGETSPLPHREDLPPTTDFRSEVVIPGPGTPEHARFLDDLRQAIVESVADGIQAHRRPGHRQRRASEDAQSFESMESLLQTNSELPRAVVEWSGTTDDVGTVNTVISACESYAKTYFAQQKRAPSTVDLAPELTLVY